MRYHLFNHFSRSDCLLIYDSCSVGAVVASNKLGLLKHCTLVQYVPFFWVGRGRRSYFILPRHYISEVEGQRYLLLY